jgi:hypothetical protein
MPPLCTFMPSTAIAKLKVYDVIRLITLWSSNLDGIFSVVLAAAGEDACSLVGPGRRRPPLPHSRLCSKQYKYISREITCRALLLLLLIIIIIIV